MVFEQNLANTIRVVWNPLSYEGYGISRRYGVFSVL